MEKLLLSKGMQLSYDDVMLYQQISRVEKRDQVSLKTRLSRNVVVNIPFVSSPMDTVSSEILLAKLSEFGGIGFVHRFFKERSDLIQFLKRTKELNKNLRVGVAIGLNTTDSAIGNILDSDCGVCCLLMDVAHGGLIRVAKRLEEIKRIFPDIDLIGGSVASANCAKLLYESGVDAIRVGIAQGSMCTTAVQTGTGSPMISSIIECAEMVPIPIIADGGIRHSGDMAKALAAGAHTVMMGKLFAKTMESENNNKKIGDKKIYRGSASFSCKKDRGEKNYIEGESTEITIEYTLEDAIKSWSDGLKSAFSYSNAFNIDDFHRNSQFILITQNGLYQSLPHGKYIL